jgi:aspartate/methionine/tyrosine aminotransferase
LSLGFACAELTLFLIFVAQVAIQTASLAFASGCHAIVFTPGYQSTVEAPGWAVDNQGISKIERRPENNWQIDTKSLRSAIRENTKYLIINEPYNPGECIFGKRPHRHSVLFSDL